MSNKYRYDHRLPHHKKRHALIIGLSSLLVLVALTAFVSWLIRDSLNTQNDQNISGPAKSYGAVLGDSTNEPSQTISEPYFTMSLPDDWHKISISDTPSNHSISWQTTIDGGSRWLTIYIDTIPADFAVNRLLPVVSQGQTLSFGILSGNCLDFTNAPNSLSPVLAKWDSVSFWCDIPNRADNKIGTGTVNAINSVTLTGPMSGSHNYFFVYTDHSAEPDYDIFYSALNSFVEK